MPTIIVVHSLFCMEAMVMESSESFVEISTNFKTWFIIPHSVATFDLIANPSTINEGNFGTPITISLVSGSSRPTTDVVITFTVSGTATGNLLELHVYLSSVNTVKITIFYPSDLSWGGLCGSW